MVLSKKELENVISAGQTLAPVLKVPRNEKEYDNAIDVLDTLLDLVRDDENHPLAPLIHALGNTVSEYEQMNIAEIETSPIERLKHLMDLQGLTQKDLASELGSQSIVSEVLSGKRELNKKHIIALSERFNVSPAVFI